MVHAVDKVFSVLDDLGEICISFRNFQCLKTHIWLMLSLQDPVLLQDLGPETTKLLSKNMAQFQETSLRGADVSTIASHSWQEVPPSIRHVMIIYWCHAINTRFPPPVASTFMDWPTTTDENFYSTNSANTVKCTINSVLSHAYSIKIRSFPNFQCILINSWSLFVRPLIFFLILLFPLLVLFHLIPIFLFLYSYTLVSRLTIFFGGHI